MELGGGRNDNPEKNCDNATLFTTNLT